MVDAVAIAGHVRTLAHGDAAAKSQAALALWRLLEPACAQNAENLVAVTSAGAIPSLVELLQSGGEGVGNATGALANLASNDDNKVAIAAAGGIAPLVEVVWSGSDRAKGWAANALRNLAYYNPDNQVAIAATGAIAPLVALTRSGGQGAEDAEAALKNLAHDNVDNRVLIAEAKGDIKELVALARSASSDAAKDAAARILARRRLAIVRKCVDGKVPAELEPIIAVCLARRGFS